MKSIRITKENASKIDRLTTCLDMCCMPWAIRNNYIHIHKGGCTTEQLEAEIKRCLG